MGGSPKEFIISRKISKAKEYISAQVPVKEVAYLLGFNNEFYFRRVFKKIVGITPREFLKPYGCGTLSGEGDGVN